MSFFVYSSDNRFEITILQVLVTHSWMKIYYHFIVIRQQTAGLCVNGMKILFSKVVLSGTTVERHKLLFYLISPCIRCALHRELGTKNSECYISMLQ